MALDLSGYVTPEQTFGGLYKAADTVREQNIRNERIAEQKESQKTATSKFLTDYLDPKDHLTGTAYDPQIVNGLQNILQQGQQLAAKGVNTNDILMALGPQVSKLNQYSVTAKTINQRIKDQVAKLKPYSGYNLESLQSQALKSAFYGPDGKLKDISTIDPEGDYITEAVKNNPGLVTTSKGLDDLVAKTPMADYSRNITTTYAGRSRNIKYEAKHPYWEDLQRDANGNVILDAAGNPVGLGIVGGQINDDNGKPVIDPETGKPMTAMNKNIFSAIMNHNPDIADYVRGQVIDHFKQAGAKNMPPEGSPQWDIMARHILGEELRTRSRSYFRTIDQQKETAPAIKVEIGQNPEMLKGLQKYEEAQKLKGDYSVASPKSDKQLKTNALETIGNVFNNNPDYLEGEQKDINGQNVIDITPYFPGGGLKSGRGDNDIFKSIYYNPDKRTLLVETQPKIKDASGNKPISLEEVPESKAGIFMSRIAAANGIDPGRVAGILESMGYKSAKFTKATNNDSSQQRIAEEHNKKIENALDSDNYESLKGIGVKDGTIEKVVGDRITFGGLRDKFSVEIKGSDGKKKTFTFKDKEALKKFLNNSPSESVLMDALRGKYNY